MKNNKYINFTYRSLLVLIILIIIIISIITSIIPTLLYLLKEGTESRINAVISLTGNIFGGLIAGVVAYLTAAHQVSRIEKENRSTNFKKAYVELMFLQQELKYNNLVFESLEPEEKIEMKKEYLKQNLKRDQWKKVSAHFINYMEEETFNKLYTLYNKIDLLYLNVPSIDEKYIQSCKSVTTELEKILDQSITLIKKGNGKLTA